MNSTENMRSNDLGLKPLLFWPSLLYFGLPALLFVFGFWAVMPWQYSFISHSRYPTPVFP